MLEDRSIGMSPNEMERGKGMNKNGTKHSRTVGYFQKV